MIKFTRSTKKKLEKVRGGGSSSSSAHHQHQQHHGPSHQSSRSPRGDQSVSSAYSEYTTRSDYTSETGTRSRSSRHGGGNGGGNRRFSSAQSVVSISSASVFAPSVAPGNDGGGGGGTGLQPSSSRTLHDLNSSRRSSLLNSIGTAASRTFRSYKMTLPRCPPPIKTYNNSGGSSSGMMMGSSDPDGMRAADEDAQHYAEDVAMESDLELLGRTVHAVSSALTEPPREGDKFMIYDVSFNPKGCVWDALIVVQLKEEEDEGGGGGDDAASKSSSRGGRSRSKSRSGRSRSRSKSRSSRRGVSSSRGGEGNNGIEGPNGWDMEKTFSFPIRVTCAEDDDFVDPPQPNPGSSSRSFSRHNPPPPSHPANKIKHAKTYAVDLSVIDDAAHHPISRWSTAEAAEHRDDIKNAMEWVSYGIRRSMARSMFPQFPEGCQGKPFREVYQLNKKVRIVV